MKKFLLLTASFLFSVSLAYSQTIRFEQVYDYDWAEAARDLQQTTDGGYVMTGSQGITIGHSRIFVTKTDSLGREEWHRFYGYPFDNEAYAIRQTSDDGFIVAGSTSGDQINSNFQDLYVIRLNAMGDTLWTNRYGGPLADIAWDLEITEDDGFIICGASQVTDSTRIDGYLLRIDSGGNLEWEQSYGTDSDEQFFGVEVLDDGGFVMTGRQTKAQAGGEVWLVRTDSKGIPLWNKSYGWEKSENAYDIKVLEDGGFIIAGNTPHFSSSLIGDILLLRADYNGDTLWTKIISNGVSDCSARAIVVLEGGGFAIVVTDYNSLESYNTILIRTDENGDTIWSQEFATKKSDYVYGLIQTKDKGFAFAGGTGNANTPSIFLIKTDYKGRLITSIKSPISEFQEIKLFPNPGSGVFYLEFSKPIVSQITLLVYNQLGQLIFKDLLNGSDSGYLLDLFEYPNGVYYLKLFTDNNTEVVRKLIISGRE